MSEFSVLNPRPAANTGSAKMQMIVDSLLSGTLDSAELSHWSWHYWNQGNFMHTVDISSYSEIKASNPRVERYLGAQEVAHRVMYGEPDKAGCVLIKAPPEKTSFEGDINDLLIPLHSHASDHIALVVRGSGTFLIKRQIGDEDVILTAESGPGTLLFYPAGIPHTFICGPEGIHVASAQAEYESPASVRFADMAPKYLGSLPRKEYIEYMAGLSL